MTEADLVEAIKKMSRSDNLSLLDLFYAVPLADLAFRISAAELDKITGADWTTIAVAVAVLVLSWVGLHQNRAEIERQEVSEWSISDIQFFSPRFVQFCLEVIITGLYFVIGLTLDLPQRSGTSSPREPSTTWVIGTLFIIWGAYLIWDALDIWIAQKQKRFRWKSQAMIGAWITVATFVTLGALLEIETSVSAGQHDHAVMWWNVGLLLLVYLYRVAQQKVKGRYNHPD